MLARFYAGRKDSERTLAYAKEWIDSAGIFAVILLQDTHYEFVFDTPQWEEWRRSFNVHPDQITDVKFEIPEFD